MQAPVLRLPGPGNIPHVRPVGHFQPEKEWHLQKPGRMRETPATTHPTGGLVKPRLLDLFCGAGGAGMGYERAGFEVTGVDNRPQPHYPFQFIQADAMTYPLDGFDAIHASPPCQRFAGTYQDHSGHPDLLTPIRVILKASGLPYVIENIATAPMPESVLLCGATFGLPIIRHRRFEIYPDPVLVPSLCPQSSYSRAVGHGPGFYPYGRKKWEAAWREHVIPAVWPWMTLDEAGQAIPPAYTEYIGHLLMEYV
jgi:DNA (cytosine-5)-methyltransferase 1